MLTTALLVGLWVTLAIIDDQTVQFHISRPIVTGPVIGLIMGDLQTGLMVGASVELMFLTIIFVGTATIPNPTVGCALATVVAILNGGGTELAIATAFPAAMIGQIVDTFQNTVVSVFFMHRGDSAVERNDMRGVMFNNALWPLMGNFIFWGLPTFLAVYFGADFIVQFIAKIPPKMIQGFAVGGGLIGAVGFGLLLTSIKAKNMWPYFLVGFILAANFHVNLITIGLIALIACVLHYNNTLSKEHNHG